MQKILWTIFFLLFFCISTFSRTIKVGDVLEIHAGENNALSKKVIVREDGTIDYPLLMDRSVVGFSIRDLMDLLTLQIAKADPSSMVVVDLLSEYKVKVNVLGQVEKPGVVIVDKDASLQEVLINAGGWNEFANLKNIKLIRKNDSYDNSIQINFEDFLEKGDISKIPPLKNGDTYIVVSIKKSKNIKVIGAVQKPGFYKAYPNANIFDIIQLAGGQSENADLTKVRHITSIDGEKIDTVVDLRKFWENIGDTENIPKVQEGDMIIVYKKTITWQLFMKYVRDAVSLFTALLLVLNYAS